MKQNYIGVLVLSLLTLGCSIVYYHHKTFDIPFFPESQSSNWLLEIKLRVSSKNEKPKVSLILPEGSDNFKIEHEQFVSDGLALATIKENNLRKASWTKKKTTGVYNLYYRALLKPIPKEKQKKKSQTKKSKKEIPLYSFADKDSQKLAKSLSFQIWQNLKKVGKKSSKDFIEEATKECLKKIPSDFNKLVKPESSYQKRLETIVRVLAENKIPARIAHIVNLERAQRNIALEPILEIYRKNNWKSYFPKSNSWNLSDSQFVWYREAWSTKNKNRINRKLVQSFRSKAVKDSISVSPEELSSRNTTLKSNRRKEISSYFFSISRLPVQTQAAYRQILLIPLGALFVAFLRNIIGLKTFGTFMPVLIGLSFQKTGLLWGLLLFISVILFGLTARFFLEKLKLLLVPRLAATLTIVVIALIGFALAASYYDFEPAYSITLFPLVIITMTIERMSVVWEEAGAKEAVKQASGSLLVASLVFLIIINHKIEYLFFSFPELLIIVLAFSIALGRYSGYRVSELIRFKDLLKATRDD